VRASTIDADNWMAHLREGIYEFLANRNVAMAFEHTSQANNPNDAIWMYNAAFLHAYEGDIDKAYSFYVRAFRKPSTASSHIQSEEFMREILEQEPDKVQLLYCLGLIYLKQRHDLVLAKEAFEDFVQTAPPERFQRWIAFSRKYLEEIDGKLGSESATDE
jgi:tetratricopeptide (TPR) repeat protein